MGLLAELQSLINEHGSATILRERLALIADQAKLLEKQMIDAKAEIADLKNQNAKFLSDLATQARSEEFIEHRGALFKRKPDGHYHMAVYCPICHKPTGALDDDFHYGCTQNCGWVGTFSPKKLESIISELP